MDAPEQIVRIRNLAHGGFGVGQPEAGEGPVWFVPGALPGERVGVVETERAARFVRGSLQTVLEPSEHRVAPPCAIADECGGCSWQHIASDVQAELKRKIVADQLRNIIAAKSIELIPSKAPLAYRRRARLHFVQGPQGLQIGFHREKSDTIVDAARCPVLVPAIEEGLTRLRANATTLRSVLPEDGEILALSDGQRVAFGFPGVKPTPEAREAFTALLDDVVVGIELRGGRERAQLGRVNLDLDEERHWPAMRATPFVFTQSQADGNRQLVRDVMMQARASGMRVLELFAGAGNFTRALAKTAQRVWASDTDRDAVDLLRGLAKAHDLPINAKRQSAYALLPKLAAANVRYDVVVLDPPRGGLKAEAAAALARVAGHRIVYVSCDPATLARDLAPMLKSGFKLRRVAVHDMMPMTPQIEIVATLERSRQ